MESAISKADEANKQREQTSTKITAIKEQCKKLKEDRDTKERKLDDIANLQKFLDSLSTDEFHIEIQAKVNDRRKDRKSTCIRDKVTARERELNQVIEEDQTFLTTAGQPMNPFEQKQKEQEIRKKEQERDRELTL